ncbi:methylated-DNA--[protein]-cysteine S-methyltransferase [Marinivivus vitaminiproducens]|uniref:methylated-DNA--[protein]-cysteine S-methyltransferase n=1 Tax=Marinivivus vitaminiproducens TaxID=3035935 RepID=UPI0027A3DCB0|nr:methylated-DNA--[protein]-cysteine S-methyltransferase [Geminicoccaceae bacterium SCSIO 64248]
MRLTHDRLSSPIGPIRLVCDGPALCALDFEDYEARMLALLRRYHGAVRLAEGRAPLPVRRALEAYFAGDLHALDPLSTVSAGTPFQRQVWTALRMVPPGVTTTYGALASSIGRPGASRAVGAANGANPVAIVVPCHRVIGSTGALIGFGGGLERKAWLLRHEAQAAAGRLEGRPRAGSGTPVRADERSALAFDGETCLDARTTPRRPKRPRETTDGTSPSVET